MDKLYAALSNEQRPTAKFQHSANQWCNFFFQICEKRGQKKREEKKRKTRVI